MDIVIWVLTGLLALLFTAAGVTKLKDDRLTYISSRPPNTSYAEDLTDGQLRGIGVLELLGVVGVIVPWATGIAKVLTPLAASGLAIVMIGAIAVHLRRGERQTLPFNAGILIVAVIVAVARFAAL